MYNRLSTEVSPNKKDHATSVASTVHFSVQLNEHPKTFAEFKAVYDELIRCSTISLSEKNLLKDDATIKTTTANRIYEILWREFSHGSRYAQCFLLHALIAKYPYKVPSSISKKTRNSLTQRTPIIESFSTNSPQALDLYILGIINWIKSNTIAHTYLYFLCLVLCSRKPVLDDETQLLVDYLIPAMINFPKYLFLFDQIFDFDRYPDYLNVINHYYQYMYSYYDTIHIDKICDDGFYKVLNALHLNEEEKKSYWETINQLVTAFKARYKETDTCRVKPITHTETNNHSPTNGLGLFEPRSDLVKPASILKASQISVNLNSENNEMQKEAEDILGSIQLTDDMIAELEAKKAAIDEEIEKLKKIKQTLQTSYSLLAKKENNHTVTETETESAKSSYTTNHSQ